jgi:hypothetical protein
MSAKSFHDASQDLGEAIDGLGDAIKAEVVPRLETVAGRMVDASDTLLFWWSFKENRWLLTAYMVSFVAAALSAVAG